MLTLHVADLAGTVEVAARLARLTRPGDVVVLAGGLGAGKTRFAQGFGSALGIAEEITSPTFTLVHSYPVDDRITLHHADLYRLDRVNDIVDLGLRELAEMDGIVLIEWGDVATGVLGEYLEVLLEPDKDVEDVGFGLDAPRLITVGASGARWDARWVRIVETLKEFRC